MVIKKPDGVMPGKPGSVPFFFSLFSAWFGDF